MVNVWASENQLVLGQLKVNEKSNEITAIPELLKILEISGAIVTIDAMLSKALDNMAYTRLMIMQS